jgi:hypothetical protein
VFLYFDCSNPISIQYWSWISDRRMLERTFNQSELHHDASRVHVIQYGMRECRDIVTTILDLAITQATCVVLSVETTQPMSESQHSHPGTPCTPREYRRKNRDGLRPASTQCTEYTLHNCMWVGHAFSTRGWLSARGTSCSRRRSRGMLARSGPPVEERAEGGLGSGQGDRPETKHWVPSRGGWGGGGVASDGGQSLTSSA